MNWFILIPLIVGLICALFGYLLGRLLSKGEDNSAEIELWQSKSTELETSLEVCRAELSEIKSNALTEEHGKIGDLDIQQITSHGDESEEHRKIGNLDIQQAPGANQSGVSSVEFDTGASRTVFGKAIKKDDLTLVQGIGPKIQELFRDYGVSTWKELAETSVARCQEILNTGGERYSVHNPGTWPRQAGLASQGKWQELWDWQNILDHGKE